MSEPPKQTFKHQVELVCLERPEPPERPDIPIGGNALNDESPRFQKRHVDRDFVLRPAQARGVRNDRDQFRSVSPKATLPIKAGRTFSVMPRSKSQTSPRFGFILFGV